MTQINARCLHCLSFMGGTALPKKTGWLLWRIFCEKWAGLFLRNVKNLYSTWLLRQVVLSVLAERFTCRVPSVKWILKLIVNVCFVFGEEGFLFVLFCCWDDGFPLNGRIWIAIDWESPNCYQHDYCFIKTHLLDYDISKIMYRISANIQKCPAWYAPIIFPLNYSNEK